MKNILFSICFICLTINVFAQEAITPFEGTLGKTPEKYFDELKGFPRKVITKLYKDFNVSPSMLFNKPTDDTNYKLITVEEFNSDGLKIVSRRTVKFDDDIFIFIDSIFYENKTSIKGYHKTSYSGYKGSSLKKKSYDYLYYSGGNPRLFSDVIYLRVDCNNNVISQEAYDFSKYYLYDANTVIYKDDSSTLSYSQFDDKFNLINTLTQYTDGRTYINDYSIKKFDEQGNWTERITRFLSINSENSTVKTSYDLEKREITYW